MKIPNGPAFGPFWLNVRWFGASGNGTPDGKPVQDAFNAAEPGQVVYFPLESPAGYNIDTAVTCPAGVLYYTEAPLIGAGSITGGQQVFLSAGSPAAQSVFSPMSYGAKGNGTNDDTGPVKAAFNAAFAAKGIVDLGGKTFLTQSAITAYTGMHVRGAGFQGGALVNNTTDLFTVTGTVEEVLFEDCSLTASAGHVFNASSGPVCSFWQFYGVQATQSAAGYSIWTQTGGDWIDCEIGDNCLFTASGSATVSPFYFSGLAGTLNSFTFGKSTCQGNGMTAVPFVDIDMGSAAGYGTGIQFRKVTFETCAGGSVSANGCTVVSIEDCPSWDVVTYSASVFSFGQSAAGYPCNNITVRRSGHVGGNLNSNYDVLCAAQCWGIVLDSNGSWGTPGVYSTPALVTTQLNNNSNFYTVPVVNTSPILGASGNTGATTGARFCGGTHSGHPASGTYAVNDFVIDYGTPCIWVCTVAGTPGTWVSLS